MSNTNEEIEKLSHGEESHFDSNHGFNKMEYPHNMNNNLNIGEINQNQNIISNQNMNSGSGNFQHNHSQNTGNQQSNESFYRLKISNKNKNFIHQHQHGPECQCPHHHQKQKLPKFILMLALRYAYMVNEVILNFFTSICVSFDTFIMRSKFPPLLKRILHTKQILLLIYIFNIQYLLSFIEGIPILISLNKISFYLMALCVAGFYCHYYYFKDRLFLQKDDEIEKFICKRNPQIEENGKCERCKILKVMRSNHCFYCDRCVLKYHFHSDWYNVCIGACNELIYAIALTFTNLYFVISDIIFWFYVLIRPDILYYLVLVFLLFAVAGLYILYNILKFYKSFILDNLLANLTVFESKMSRRLTYLWSTDRISLFNPFNKGFQRNLEELWINFLDIDIYADYKNYASQNLGEVFDDEKEEEEDPNDFYNIGGFKMILKLSDHVDPFVSSKGNIYKFVDGKEIINWNRLMVFTAFDVINSPFKDIMVKRAKFSLIEYKKREVYMKMNEIMEKNRENKEIEKDEENNENEKDEDNKENEKDEENNENEKNEENKDNEKNGDNEENEKKEDNEDHGKNESDEDNEKHESGDENKEKLDENENDKSEDN